MLRSAFVLALSAWALGGCASAPPPRIVYVEVPASRPPPRVAMEPYRRPWQGPRCAPPGYAMRPPRTPARPYARRHAPHGPRETVPHGGVPQRQAPAPGRMGRHLDHSHDSATVEP